MTATDQAVRVLVIDDDVAILQELQVFLRRKVFEPVIASRPEEGLMLFDAVNPGIVICDVKMPGMKGCAVLDEIRKRNPEMQVIIISGTIDNHEGLNMLRKGAYTFMHKPVDLFMLLHTMRMALERGEMKSEIAQLKSRLAAGGD